VTKMNGQTQMIPPLARNTYPLIQPASGPARKTTASVIDARPQ
jgi:hypothetical protein